MDKQRPKPNQYVIKQGAVPPAVVLMNVSDKDWENFIEEACRQRSIAGSAYASVKVLGNAKDKGRDVEARLSPDLIEDNWDLYQAKHYKDPLSPGVAFPEIAKFLGHLYAGSYPAPRKYYFCAPRGVGPDLHDLLADPEKLKASFLAAWKAGTHGMKLSVNNLSEGLVAFIEGFDFSKFEECQVHDLLSWHQLDTRSHYKRFGIEAERGDDPDVPNHAIECEMTYVSELIKAYCEHHGSDMTLEDVINSDEYAEHYEAVRANFYAAEGLRRFSRDLYPDDEFAKLLEMVLQGVRPAAKSPLLKTGLARHEAAMSAANVIKVTDSVLHSRLRGGDLPGACHHLVNDKKLKWVK
ncbi:ABC-three component system protein [Stenotrophomonas sp.]|uniref:ABC-three component system protein n=1 Tax=Stenotrophomonas sp. TaxID=69392 RepID=UPI0028A6CA6B|nr:ABC-three component system protein [Stenotrophomonas sp.]